ncbi:MAG: hypothetical protein C4528_02710 [Gammaproteobacteria bacterium]|nr:MAG: hypothetical protein C4528_02710 [Gammaproteobacteria bacterium]
MTADTLRKLGVAPKNESYVINVLRFLGIIDEEGKKVDAKAKAFVQHQEDAFASEFGKIVKEAYEELFELHGDTAWTQDRNALTQFFRTTDHSSDVVGTRQAGTFSALTALAGHAEVPAPKASGTTKKPKTTAADSKLKQSKAARGSQAAVGQPAKTGGGEGGMAAPVGLTVRIEVNLPASGDQETYDRIFQSIRKNLLNGP